MCIHYMNRLSLQKKKKKVTSDSITANCLKYTIHKSTKIDINFYMIITLHVGQQKIKKQLQRGITIIHL